LALVLLTPAAIGLMDVKKSIRMSLFDMANATCIMRRT